MVNIYNTCLVVIVEHNLQCMLQSCLEDILKTSKCGSSCNKAKGAHVQTGSRTSMSNVDQYAGSILQQEMKTLSAQLKASLFADCSRDTAASRIVITEMIRTVYSFRIREKRTPVLWYNATNLQAEWAPSFDLKKVPSKHPTSFQSGILPSGLPKELASCSWILLRPLASSLPFALSPTKELCAQLHGVFVECAFGFLNVCSCLDAQNSSRSPFFRRIFFGFLGSHKIS